jgi:hypothetical protein
MIFMACCLRRVQRDTVARLTTALPMLVQPHSFHRVSFVAGPTLAPKPAGGNAVLA